MDPNAPPPSGFDPAMMQAYMQLMHMMASQGQGGMPGAGLPGAPAGYPFPAAPAAPHPYAAAAAPAAPPDPTVAVSVEGMKFQYQLTEDDISKVFSRYGAVKSIQVDDAGNTATIAFFSMSDAQSAMSDLDGKVLNGLDGTLRMRWVNAVSAPAVPPPYPSMPFSWPPQGPNPYAAAAAYASGAAPPAYVPPPGAYGSIPGSSAMAAAGGNSLDGPAKGVRKYTCRFIIGIENDKDFQVARRIIGAKGANMKRIVKATEAKLRLRGVGSGYLEGAGQKESQEPLQLCISCTSLEGYQVAVRSVEDILKRTYDEYRAFCQERGLLLPDLKINLSENQLVYSPGRPGDIGQLDEDKRAGRSGRKRMEAAKQKGGSEVDRGEPGPNAPPVDEIERLIDERNEARRASNFQEADRIRDDLHEIGVALMDEPGGRGKGAEVTTWRYWRD